MTGALMGALARTTPESVAAYEQRQAGGTQATAPEMGRSR